MASEQEPEQELAQESIWISVLDTAWMDTYSEQPYTKFPVNPKFEEILTVSDLKNIKEFPARPTGCRFIPNAESVFFFDPQGNYDWSQDSVSKKIYVSSNDGPKRLVAESLPEFLSHLDSEYREWWAKNKH